MGETHFLLRPDVFCVRSVSHHSVISQAVIIIIIIIIIDRRWCQPSSVSVVFIIPAVGIPITFTILASKTERFISVGLADVDLDLPALYGSLHSA